VRTTTGDLVIGTFRWTVTDVYASIHKSPEIRKMMTSLHFTDAASVPDLALANVQTTMLAITRQMRTPL
jgi:hypothetical protein